MKKQAEFGLGIRALPLSYLLPTVDSLGISDELKDKLEDVLIPEQQFTLGRMLGKGVWPVQGWQEFAFSDGFWLLLLL